MLATPLRGLNNLKKYEEDCEKYNEIIKMFAELGSGKLDRRDVLSNIKSMINNGLIEKLEDVIEDIEMYEFYH